MSSALGASLFSRISAGMKTYALQPRTLRWSMEGRTLLSHSCGVRHSYYNINLCRKLELNPLSFNDRCNNVAALHLLYLFYKWKDE